jgi:hypothetical protein
MGIDKLTTDQRITEWLKEIAEKVRAWEHAESIDIKLIWVSDCGHIYTRYRPKNSRYRDDFTKSEASRPCDLILADLAEICDRYGIIFEEISFPGNHENRVSSRGLFRYMPKSARFYASIDLPGVALN